MIGVGTQVVCLSDVWFDDAGRKAAVLGMNVPHKGSVYTVRGIYKSSQFDFVGLRLEELINAAVDLVGLEPAFDINGFRPVKKTSIDQFTSLLSPVTPKHLEPV